MLARASEAYDNLTAVDTSEEPRPADELNADLLEERLYESSYRGA